MGIQKRYELETGQKATYRKGSSDYHTLKYVRWLENIASQQDNTPDAQVDAKCDLPR